MHIDYVIAAPAGVSSLKTSDLEALDGGNQVKLGAYDFAAGSYVIDGSGVTKQ
jgi:hypothetical protein